MVEDVGELLDKAGLSQFSDNFRHQGFTTAESLMILTMQDYAKFGVVQTEDKRKLFQIIQQQKQVKNKDGANKRMSSVIARLTSSEKKSKEKKETRIDNTPPNSMYFNRATFLRRSFNKTKGTESDNSSQNRTKKQSMGSMQDRTRYPSAQTNKVSLSASAENINKLRQTNNNNDRNNSLRKSASGRTDIYSGRENQPTVTAITRSRAKTTSIITSSVNSARKGGSKTSDKIKVCVRKRPLNKKEKVSKETDIIEMVKPHQCHVSEPKTSVDLTKFIQKHCFIFDAVFEETSNNENVYQNTAKPLVDWVFQGNKATCFAYGQTGSGKTYTMVGAKHVEGLVMLAARDIFSTVRSQKYGNDFKVFVSFYEIYCGQLFDLINKRKRLTALENAKKAICIVGLEEREVHSHTDVINLVNQGGNRRSSGSTSVNSESSRSHAILQIALKSKEGKARGKFSFIDLAGSERAADVSDTNKQTRYEGAEINTSLLALKECIRALDQESKHTPFRQSKLTQVLRDSFIGNSKTCMISCVSPNISSCEDSLNTLRYADRVKELGKDDLPVKEQSKEATSQEPSSPPTDQHLTTNGRDIHENNHNLEMDSSFGSWLDTSDLAGDLPSDISLVSRTDESDTSFASAAENNAASDTKETRNGCSPSKDQPRDPPKDPPRDLQRDSTKLDTTSSHSEVTGLADRQVGRGDNKPGIHIIDNRIQPTNSRRPSLSESTSQHSGLGPRDTGTYRVRKSEPIPRNKPEQVPEPDTAPLYSYPKPPATAPPNAATRSEGSGVWMERSRTMASAPRTRISVSENKMKKAQDDLVASHQIHISQVTNLCSIEAELLQNFVDGHLDFAEYMKKLETILESKNKCVESLRAQVACYSLRATY